jgi:twitching motility protein PilT
MALDQIAGELRIDPAARRAAAADDAAANGAATSAADAVVLAAGGGLGPAGFVAKPSPQESRALLERLLAECVRQDASDLHIAPNLPAHLRVHGVLELQHAYGVLRPAATEGLADVLCEGFNRTTISTTGSVDGAISASDGTRYRFNVFKRQGEFSIALRRLEDSFRSLAELGFSETLYDLCSLPDGLVVVAGPTGAGKSTTLATLIDRINKTRPAHIVTIEDPIEYLHPSAKALVNQRQVGLDTGSFNDALVASLRQDPDVILVGEIRDLNTIRTAITAAETGHLVFTTVHAGDCVGAIERLVSVFPAEEQAGIRRQLSLVLRSIITQHLLVADGRNGLLEPTAEGVQRRRRVVVSEVLMASGAVSNLIANGKAAQIYSVMESGGAGGMQTLEEDLARLWAGGWITEATALNVSRNPAIVRDRFNRLASRTTLPARAGGGGK